MRTIRSFLAVKLDLDTVRSLAEVQKRLRQDCDQAGMSVRWVPPPNIHMTIRFLGQITEPMAIAVKDMLEPVAAGIRKFEMEVKGLGAFPDLKRPRVVWAGVGEGADQLAEIHTAVCNRLLSAGFDLDDKPFKAHITIGRVKGGPGEALASCIGDDADSFFGNSWVRGIACYRSDLAPQGAEYHTIWRLSFQGSGHGGARREAEPKESTEGSDNEQSPPSRQGTEGSETA